MLASQTHDIRQHAITQRHAYSHNQPHSVGTKAWSWSSSQLSARSHKCRTGNTRTSRYCISVFSSSCFCSKRSPKESDSVRRLIYPFCPKQDIAHTTQSPIYSLRSKTPKLFLVKLRTIHYAKHRFDSSEVSYAKGKKNTRFPNRPCLSPFNRKDG